MRGEIHFKLGVGFVALGAVACFLSPGAPDAASWVMTLGCGILTGVCGLLLMHLSR